jgi:hypothetical protein
MAKGIEQMRSVLTTGREPASRGASVDPWPRDGDLLIARRTATVEHDVLVMPGGEVLARARYELAVAAGRNAAQQLGVDLWRTEDHKHFRKVATFRDADPHSG